VKNKKQISIYKFRRIALKEKSVIGSASLYVKGEKDTPVICAVRNGDFVYTQYMATPGRSVYARFALQDVIKRGEDIVVFVPDETVIIF
jgi:hypothetical protein